VDFRFKYRRKPPDAAEQRAEERLDSDRVRRVRGLAIGLSIPLSLVAGPLAGWLAGGWLDRTLGTGYWTPVLIVLGTAAGLKMVIDMLIRLGQDK
jgi:F0F1-type ATP synthase assembly protein I